MDTDTLIDILEIAQAIFRLIPHIADTLRYAKAATHKDKRPRH